MPGGLVHPYQLDESIPNFQGICCISSFVFRKEIPVSNRVDPYQMPQNVPFKGCQAFKKGLLYTKVFSPSDEKSTV